MILATESATYSVPTAAICTLIETAPTSAETAIDLLWRGGTQISGSLDPLLALTRLNLLQTVQLLAMSPRIDLDLVPKLIEGATPVDNTPQLHAVATLALARPEIMRWISANVARVDDTPNWKAVVPGLGGATVSVPLAEEALTKLMSVKSDVPRELAEYVQFNPWFSRRFAIRYRRRMGGKRIRVRERGATARAWSHGRTVVSSELPAEWRSLHGRGVGRPLDRWSHRLLTNYADQLARFYGSKGIPPTIASLFVVAHAGADLPSPPRETATGWDAFPAPTEQKARRLIGLGDITIPRLAQELAAARPATSQEQRAWSAFLEVVLAQS